MWAVGLMKDPQVRKPVGRLEFWVRQGEHRPLLCTPSPPHAGGATVGPSWGTEKPLNLTRPQATQGGQRVLMNGSETAGSGEGPRASTPADFPQFSDQCVPH